MSRGKRKKIIKGICSVCGKEGDINFEHVPPQSCGNKQTQYTKSTLKEIFVNTETEVQKKRIMQGGLGYYAFCESCNNQFGTWYVKEYSEFYKTALKILRVKTNNIALVVPFEIYPLRIIKQVICMFLAVNHNYTSDFDRNILNDFVLDKEKTGLPSQFKIFAYYNRGGRPRIMPFTSRGNLDTFKPLFEANNLNALTSSKHSEIAFPPFGFVLTYNAQKPDHRLLDITHFADYSYNTKANIRMALAILPTHTKYPCTYKTKGELERAGVKI